MRKFVYTLLLVASVAGVAGALYAQLSPGYTCPITGELLPCPSCCPLNRAR